MKVKNKNGYELDFDTAILYMVGEIREQVHSEIAPWCTEQDFLTAYEEGAEKCVCFKDRNRLIHLPCAVKDLIDKIIGHNEIVAIWESRKNKEGRYHALLWKGMAWDIPEEYLDRTFLKIFGTVPETITEADTVNISVTPILKSVEEAEQALKESENNDRRE